MVFVIIFLFIVMGIAPSVAVDNIEQCSMSISNGKTLYVGGSGLGNYTKIQDAIDNSSYGDTVFVYDDSAPYYESIIIYKTIEIIGENRETTIIDGKNSGDVIIINADNVTISKLNIQNSSNPIWDSGIHIWSNFTRIIDNIITLNQGIGIYFEEMTNDNLVSGNIITYNDKAGIYVDKRGTKKGLNPDNNTFINNLITRNKGIGIMLMWGWLNNVTENIISYNQGGGIEVNIRSNNFISKNDIISNGDDGIQIWDSNRNIIYENNILNNADEGIFIIASEYNEIFSNNISDNIDGLGLDNCDNNLIFNNIFSKNQNNGIYLFFSEKNSIFENEFISNKIGVCILDYCRNNVFSDNNFFNDGLFIETTLSNTYSNNIINGKPFLLLIDKSDKTLDNVDAGQIILMKCKSITVKNQDLSNTAIGIELYSSSNCLIDNNVITNNNRYGIYIKGGSNTVCWNHIENCNNAIYISGSNNVISYNNIYKNSNGIFWYGQSNTVKNNNFISNLHNAKFHMTHNGGLTTKWSKNYWDRTRILPKAIMGKKDIFLIEIMYSDIVLPIPWISFDWRPALRPYNIRV